MTYPSYQSSLGVGGGRFEVQKAFHTSTSALSRGYGVCFNADRGTAASVDEGRRYEVEAPSQTNNLWFAGVLESAYVANANGQEVTLQIPGGLAYIYVGDSSTTVAGTIVTCNVTDGKFYAVNGYMGRGSALVLQTLSSAGIALAYLYDGEESGMFENLAVANAATTFSPMVGGLTRLTYANCSGGNCVATLANATGRGAYFGLRKGFATYTANATTASYQVATTNTYGFAGNATAVATATTATKDLRFDLQWRGTHWEIVNKYTGWTLA
jgi:hypothetical protein